MKIELNATFNLPTLFYVVPTYIPYKQETIVL